MHLIKIKIYMHELILLKMINMKNLPTGQKLRVRSLTKKSVDGTFVKKFINLWTPEADLFRTTWFHHKLFKRLILKMLWECPVGIIYFLFYKI